MVYTLKAMREIQAALSSIGATEFILRDNFDGIDFFYVCVGYQGLNYMFLFVDLEDYGVFKEQYPADQWQGQIEIVSSVAEIYQALRVGTITFEEPGLYRAVLDENIKVTGWDKVG